MSTEPPQPYWVEVIEIAFRLRQSCNSRSTAQAQAVLYCGPALCNLTPRRPQSTCMQPRELLLASVSPPTAQDCSHLLQMAQSRRPRMSHQVPPSDYMKSLNVHLWKKTTPYIYVNIFFFIHLVFFQRCSPCMLPVLNELLCRSLVPPGSTGSLDPYHM